MNDTELIIKSLRYILGEQLNKKPKPTVNEYEIFGELLKRVSEIGGESE